MNLLIGNFGDKNLGDELILLAALSDYPGAMVMTSDANFSQNFTETQFQTVPFPPLGLRSVFRYITHKSYRQQLQKLKALPIENLVFAGGGLFAIKWQACVLWWLTFFWLHRALPKAAIRFEYQGVDKNLSPFSRWCARQAFEKANYISVRDAASGEALASMGIEKYEIKKDRVDEYLAGESSAVSRESLLILNALKPFDASVVEAKFPKHKIIFVPFALSDIAVLPDDFPHEVIFPQTKTELFKLLCKAEVLVGERFHSIVCGQHFVGTENTFTLRAPYSEKVRSFCTKEGIKPV